MIKSLSKQALNGVILAAQCLGMNDDRLGEWERCASTSNRNFEGRQGRNGRTHLGVLRFTAAAGMFGKSA